MPSTISAGTVTVKITETVSLNGSTYDATNVLSIQLVNEVSQRIMTLPGQQNREIAKFTTTVGPGEFLRSQVQYMRITNLDDTNSLAVGTRASLNYAWQLLTPGRSWILSAGDVAFEGVTSAAMSIPSLGNVDSVWCYGSSIADIDIEFFIALT